MTRARCAPTGAGEDRTQDLAGALHEVSNALTVVLGWLDVARSKLPNGPERDALEVARTHARIGYGIARHAIGAEVAEAGAPQAGARATATTAVTGVTPEATRRGVELVIDAVRAGHEQIASVGPALQILTNLLLNAIAFTPRGRKVTLTVRDDGSYAIFTVKDEGPGIPADRIDSIFEGPVSTRRGGAGVGLRHSYSLAESHGGCLSIVRSTPTGAEAEEEPPTQRDFKVQYDLQASRGINPQRDPNAQRDPSASTQRDPRLGAPLAPRATVSVNAGGASSSASTSPASPASSATPSAPSSSAAPGACFELRWPLAEARSSTRPQQPLVASVRGARVLVLEDDAAVRSLIELALEARGAETVLTASQREFERALSIGGFDTALVDLSPIADCASQVLTRLRASNPGIAVILISGVASGVPEEIEAQVTTWVRKPFEMGEVLDAMSRLLEARRQAACADAERDLHRAPLDSAAG